MKNKFAFLLSALLFIIILLSTIVFVQETNILFRQKDSVTTKTVFITDFVDEIGTATLMLKRNDKTPIGLEYVTFDNEEQYKFVSLNENEVHKESLLIFLPKNVENNRYFITLEAKINGVSYNKEVSFRVGDLWD